VRKKIETNNNFMRPSLSAKYLASLGGAFINMSEGIAIVIENFSSRNCVNWMNSFVPKGTKSVNFIKFLNTVAIRDVLYECIFTKKCFLNKYLVQKEDEMYIVKNLVNKYNIRLRIIKRTVSPEFVLQQCRPKLVDGSGLGFSSGSEAT
jgi:hypothetical protein